MASVILGELAGAQANAPHFPLKLELKLNALNIIYNMPNHVFWWNIKPCVLALSIIIRLFYRCNESLSDPPLRLSDRCAATARQEFHWIQSTSIAIRNMFVSILASSTPSSLTLTINYILTTKYLLLQLFHPFYRRKQSVGRAFRLGMFLFPLRYLYMFTSYVL